MRKRILRFQGPWMRLVLLPGLRVPPALAAPWLYAGRSTEELRSAHAAAMNRVSPDTINARVAAVLSVDYRARLRDVEVPMLYLRALRDRLIPRSAGDAILELRRDVELAEFAAPHFLLQTEPRACAERVTRFVERCS